MATYNRGPLAALHQLLLSIEGVKATEQPPPKKRKKFRTDEEKKKQTKHKRNKKKKKKDNVVRIRLKTFPLVPLMSLGRIFIRYLNMTIKPTFI